MKKPFLLSLILSTLIPGAAAQKRPAKDHLDVFVASPWHLNRLNVKNDERYPSTITSRNDVGYYLGITYSRFKKNHWIFSGEVGYGQTNHDVTFTVPTNIYDSIIGAAFGPTVSLSTLTRIRYAQLALWAGYQYNLNTRWHLEGRIGVAQKIRFGGEYEARSVTAIASDNNGNTLYKTLFNYGNALAADSYQKGIINYGNFTGELYLGCRKDISGFFINGIQIGIVCSRIIISPDPIALYVNTYGSGSVLPISQDRYEDLNAAIGLRIGASLW